MKRNETNIRKILARYLGRYGDPLPPRETSAVEQVWRKLEPEVVRTPMRVALESKPAHGWRFPSLAFATGLVVLAVVLVPYFKAHLNPARAVVEIADGDMVRVSGDKTQSVRVGESVRANEIVRSSRGDAVLMLADGSRVEMRAASELSLERADDGVRIRLNSGSVIVTAAKQRMGHLYVQTRDVTVSVVGTVFYVNAEKLGSRVAVVEGEVHVQQGESLKKLLPGEQVTSSPLMKAQPVSEEIAWSRSAEAHLALLQRSTTVEAPPLKFEVASIKPDSLRTVGTMFGFTLGPVLCRGNDGRLGQAPPGVSPDSVVPMTVPLGRCIGRSVTLSTIISLAYGVSLPNISNVPDWAAGTMETFQIEALAENPATTTREQLRQMLQTLLADRFKLKFHRDTRESQGYALVVAKDALKLKDTTLAEEPLVLKSGNGIGGRGGGVQMTLTVAGRTSMSAFAAFLGTCPLAGRPVVDKTDLSGIYDFNFMLNLADAAGPCSLTYDPSLARVLENQLGLRLDAQKVMGDVIVIDHVEKPSEN